MESVSSATSCRCGIVRGVEMVLLGDTPPKLLLWNPGRVGSLVRTTARDPEMVGLSFLLGHFQWREGGLGFHHVQAPSPTGHRQFSRQKVMARDAEMESGISPVWDTVA